MYVGGDGQQAIGYADRKFSGEAKENYRFRNHWHIRED